jgi:hypothetical protein
LIIICFIQKFVITLHCITRSKAILIKTVNTMLNTTEIIEKCNSLVKFSNFTKIVKTNYNSGVMIFVITSYNFDLYMDRFNDSYYIDINKQLYELK